MTHHTSTSPTTDQVQRVEKPWGYEVIWAVQEGSYVGKMLFVHAGHSLSVQYHRQKVETLYAIEGTVRIEVGPDEDNLQAHVLSKGGNQSITVPAGYVHRLEALDDATVLEVSSADPGWTTDVVRLFDSYGREGTDTP